MNDDEVFIFQRINAVQRAVRKMELSFRMRNVSSSVFLTCLTTPYEKCDTTGQMKDIRLSLVNVLLML